MERSERFMDSLRMNASNAQSKKGYDLRKKSVLRKNLTIPLAPSETLTHRAFEASEVLRKTSLKPN